MLSIRNLSASFGSFELKNIDLEIRKGEYFVLLGPSGAGKSLLFEVLAGIYKPGSGNVLLNSNNITNLPADKRGIGLVFQDNTLFPHFSVRRNIAYPLRLRNHDAKSIREKIEQLARDLRIGHLLDRSMSALSGGEIQRIALARALAADPEYLLLDEPVSSIDVQLRDEIMELLQKINNSGITILHITHDLSEAIRLADHLAFMENGKIIQVGKPIEIFNQPVNEFVARFIGYSNIFSFEEVSHGSILIEGKITLHKKETEAKSGRLIIPDQAIQFSKKGDNTFDPQRGIIRSIVHFPEFTEYVVDIGIQVKKKLFEKNTTAKEGDESMLWIDSEKLLFLRQNE